MPQLELKTIPPIVAPTVFTHIVTLRHPRTEDEQCLTIETMSDRFADVLREIQHQRVMHELFGYEILEVLDCNDPF